MFTVVRILANSVCDFTPQQALEMNVSLIPDTILFGDRVFRNGVDIDPPSLYKKLQEYEKLPTTAHCNIYEFMQAFRAASVGCDEILCLSLTSKMSGSFSAASIAAQTLNDDPEFKVPVFIYDSLQVSYGLAVLVQKASDLAGQGACTAQILPELDKLRARVGVYFVMESLQNAKKGGRVGAIRVLAADLLGIKPVLQFSDGLVRDIGLVRKLTEGYDALVEKYRTRAVYGGDVYIFHAEREETAQHLAKVLTQIDPAARIHLGWVGAVIGIYTGTGCVGLAFTEKEGL